MKALGTIAVIMVLAGCGTAAAPPRPVPAVTRTITAPPRVITRVVTQKVPVPGPTVTRTVAVPFTVPCTQGASVALIVGQEPPGATVVPMACTVTLNPDWGGLTVTAPDGLSVSLTGPAGGY